MRVARWFYVHDATFPPHDTAGRPFHHPTLYAEIMRVVKKTPGLTGSEIASRVGKSKEYVAPLLWDLKRYGNAVRAEKVGFVRTPGLDEFAQTPDPHPG